MRINTLVGQPDINDMFDDPELVRALAERLRREGKPLPEGMQDVLDLLDEMETT